jgi:3-hydroxyisobutyrate dehydrogenase-like beta-hydroxyacid dehydrogenase
MNQASVCLLGFGEVGQTLAVDLMRAGVRSLCAWDVLFTQEASAPSRAARELRVRIARDAPSAAPGAQLVVSAVTAAQATEAARSIVPGLAHDAFYLELNSVGPEVKQEIARIVGSTHARYVEGAVMSPIGPQRIASPILLGGPQAAAFASFAQPLGFTGTKVFAQEIGRASAAKMSRSVLVKGMEALLAESLLTARRHGVEETVLASLQQLFPGVDWRKLARYMISRSLVHGARRAEEMREVARTVASAGIEPHMSTACAERQDWAGQFSECAEVEGLEAMLDAVLSRATSQK